MWRMLRIPAVYTLETSLCGADRESSMSHFSKEHLYELGRKLCLSIMIFQDIKIPD